MSNDGECCLSRTHRTGAGSSHSTPCTTMTQRTEAPAGSWFQQLLSLPGSLLQAVFGKVSSSTRHTLMQTSKEARRAVLLHEPHLRYTIRDPRPGKQPDARLTQLLAERCEPLHLKLHVIGQRDTESTTHILTQLASQQYPRSSGGHGCVTELTLFIGPRVRQVSSCVVKLLCPTCTFCMPSIMHLCA